MIGIFFGPFLLASAVTGLLWAYAPHLYLRPASAGSTPAPVMDENRTYASVSDVIRAAKAEAGEGRIGGLYLKPMAGRLVYTVNVESKKGMKEVWVDADTGEAELAPKDRALEFHVWVMRIHRLGFFGTKKELTAIPGTALLLMIVTGLFLLKRGIK